MASAENDWTMIYDDAYGVAGNLTESWKRRVRHNKALERLALWHTVRLELHCEKITAVHSNISKAAVLASGPPYARYEIAAAISMIPALPPFTEFELQRLRVNTGEVFERWGDDMAEREPTLVETWHEWLWQGDFNDRGQASLLLIAATHLANNIPEIFDWEPHGR